MTTVAALPLYIAISATTAMGVGTEVVGSASQKPWVAYAGKIMGLVPLFLLTAWGSSRIGDILVGRVAVTASLEAWINAGVIAALIFDMVHMMSLILDGETMGLILTKESLDNINSGVKATAYLRAFSHLVLFSIFWMGVTSQIPLGSLDLNAKWYAKIALTGVPIGIMSGLSLYSAATYRYANTVEA